ncbi:MAG TPA: FHA domain-containing protein [Acidimicrobiales bacterium]|nr:FHA domain-containing protein [Acidimicrobiales bacterium]
MLVLRGEDESAAQAVGTGTGAMTAATDARTTTRGRGGAGDASPVHSQSGAQEERRGREVETPTRDGEDAMATTAHRQLLGLLTWDNGDVDELVGPTLLGRDVSLGSAVSSGELAPLVPRGQNDSMSRVHAELRASGSDVVVVDRASTNGTFIWDEGSKAWHRLVPGEPHVLRPGAILAFGERTATFSESVPAAPKAPGAT